MDLKNIIVEKAQVVVEHPTLEGFKVQVNYISKDKMRKLLDRSTTTQYNRMTHKPEEDLDNDIFLKLYAKELIAGWDGLKLDYLNDLIPVDLTSFEDLNMTVNYTEENALLLLKSVDFDNWLSSVVSDITVFNKTK